MKTTNGKTIEELQAEGYAIALFSPEELRGASVNQLESFLYKEGKEAIDFLSLEPDEKE